MARRKKKTQVQEEQKVEETKQEETVKEIKSTTQQAVGYQGEVRVKVQNGKKTVLSKTFHNSGRPNLFKFISDALAGNFVADSRPCKIKLFTLRPNEEPEKTTFNDEDWSSTYEASPFVLYDTTAVVTSVKDTTTGLVDHYSTTYHFRIPFSYISKSSIYKAALYKNSVSQSSDNIEMCAYYLFTSKDSNNKVIWAPIEKTSDNKTTNYSIIIEWTVSVKNVSA